jgi:hydroxymethylpyrimidine/phosphomethylpyrimidine kinase
MTSSVPKILTFAASDPTGGAGMQADLMTQTSLGCYPLSVLTAITCQDTSGVSDVLPIDPSIVEKQARLILNETKIDVIKCGVMASEENIKVISEIIKDYPDVPVVIDPILSSGRGDNLALGDSLQLMIRHLFPLAEIITPNVNEAAKIISNKNISEIDEDLLFIGKSLMDLGPKNVLITAADYQVDKKTLTNTLFCQDGGIFNFDHERLPQSFHGSGCTLASAIAAYLAQGMSIHTAVEEAQKFTIDTLKNGLVNGNGQLIPNRFFWMFSDLEEDENDPKHH